MPRGLLLEEVACVPGCSREPPPPLCISSLSLSHTHAPLAVTQLPLALPATSHEPLGWRVSRGALPPHFFSPFILRESRLRESWRWQPSRNFHFWHCWLGTESNLLLWSPFNAPSRWPGREEREECSDNLRISRPIRDDDPWREVMNIPKVPQAAH